MQLLKKCTCKHSNNSKNIPPTCRKRKCNKSVEISFICQVAFTTGGPRPVDGKRLQLILQGCIGTTVNQGPTEIALTFLNVDDIDADGGKTISQFDK